MAIAYYTQVLGFDLIEDTDLGAGKRWALSKPHASAIRLAVGSAFSAHRRLLARL